MVQGVRPVPCQLSSTLTYLKQYVEVMFWKILYQGLLPYVEFYKAVALEG
jgi:hypothetical protein